MIGGFIMNPEDMKFCQSDLKAKITVNTAIWMVSLPVTLQWKK